MSYPRGYPRGYPRVYSAIKEMALKEALHTKTARAIARKAGVRSGSTDAPSGVATVIDAMPGATFVPLWWQWVVNLSAYSQMRMQVRHHDNVNLFFSPTLGDDLDPGDYEKVTGVFPSLGGTFEFRANESIEPVWMDLPEEMKTSVRLCPAHDLGEAPFPSVELATDLGGPWHLLVEAR